MFGPNDFNERSRIRVTLSNGYTGFIYVSRVAATFINARINGALYGISYENIVAVG